MISRAGQWTQTPSATPLQPKKWNAHFWITFNFWWWAGLVNGLEPHLPPLSSQKIEMLDFGLCSTSDDWPGWSMDSNPICHPSQRKKWNAHFCITFNFWWLAGLVDGLKPHLPPSAAKKTSEDRPGWSMDSNPIHHLFPAKKNEMLIFGLHSTSDDQPGWSTDSNPICHPSPAKKMKCSFWITFNFWWWAGLVNGLKPHLPPLSPAKKMKCSFLDYVQLLMMGWAGRWTRTPSATPLQPK